VKVIALIDGEHYPSVTRWGLASARAGGFDVVAALVVGGIEKLDADGRIDLGQARVLRGEDDPRGALSRAIEDLEPEGVLDLSDEPVLGYRTRMELAAETLVRGIPYLGPDFRLEPPVVDEPLPASTLAVIGTGKRVAKTAIAGHAARVAAAAGHRPVMVAMGRGGPPGPVVAGPEDVRLEALLARADRGEHAASDYLEDALTAGVPTVGARRCGGGLAGRPFVTNVAEAAAVALGLGGDLIILEGSGSSVPTVPWDAGILVMPDSLPVEHLAGYMGPLRLLLSDLAVLIIGSGSREQRDRPSTLESQVRRLGPEVRVAIVELEPHPLNDVRDKDAFFATTAPPDVARDLAMRVEHIGGCRVVAFSGSLSDRPQLERDMASSPHFDVLLTELKASAIDVAARRALDLGAEVVFVDNRPRPVGGDAPIDELMREVAGLAVDRADRRQESSSRAAPKGRP
jgi:cyclic 2,3-diphosphoglycerate synthetase